MNLHGNVSGVFSQYFESPVKAPENSLRNKISDVVSSLASRFGLDASYLQSFFNQTASQFGVSVNELQKKVSSVVQTNVMNASQLRTLILNTASDIGLNKLSFVSQNSNAINQSVTVPNQPVVVNKINGQLEPVVLDANTNKIVNARNGVPLVVNNKNKQLVSVNGDQVTVNGSPVVMNRNAHLVNQNNGQIVTLPISVVNTFQNYINTDNINSNDQYINDLMNEYM